MTAALIVTIYLVLSAIALYFLITAVHEEKL
jgi:hypothetical protein